MNDTAATTTNAPEYSVSDLASAIKGVIEHSFGRVRVRGELSGLSRPASGHIYTKLKDDTAVIDAVCWKSSVARLKTQPQEGMEVICTGRLTTYPGRSTYQLVIEQMEVAGIGAILKLIEERRQRLTAEGLFDAARKRPLPFLPRRIAVVTSPTGAVIRDILHRLSDRFPVPVWVWPATVQGDTAAAEVTRAIVGLNELAEIRALDLIIVARGGGSVEDLMPFNDEALVRAVAASRVPIISAVGHETDTTLCDYAADWRAPTPTAAAEKAVPVRLELLGYIDDVAGRMGTALNNRLQRAQERLALLSRPLATPARLLEQPTQRLDRADLKLQQALKDRMASAAAQFSRLHRIPKPTELLRRASDILNNHTQRLDNAITQQKQRQETRLNTAIRMLDTLSYRSTLARGYAVVRNAHGVVQTTATTARTENRLVISFADADVSVVPDDHKSP